MYIIELIAKLNSRIRQGDFKLFKKKPKAEPDEERCEHIFVPVDSTKKVLACSKCGYLLKVDPKKIKKSNPFGS